MTSNQPSPRSDHQRWQPTARSAHGRHVQASQHRQALIEAIAARGQQLGMAPGQVSAAIIAADDQLRAHGWHPEQFAYGDPIDDFVTGADADYDEY
ncbi:hypothetical protein [Couchioplanes caeruleus]|uniref:Uncharacterized protein n=2 Tax=Couchioplanes caeruleus TaxID=56438 RepID=A0A1K0H1F0_9ACTN|nr:hypothetical protein [Couchioplanes caeruleus]OJF15523.1 hypothetical protein BG844_04055 [Couchioplanes caeruleus subsp. caeruleus]ROP30938.1 hypothetical protein EDD30_3823 [Couchioplanes caeruleus]